jgi:outer membrane protein assembly factor BamB
MPDTRPPAEFDDKSHVECDTHLCSQPEKALSIPGNLLHHGGMSSARMRMPIKLSIAVTLVLSATAAFFWLLPNVFSAAPVAWSTEVGEFDGPWWCDDDSVYCVTSMCGVSGSETGLSRFDRRTGKRIWIRHQATGPERWQSEKGHVFTKSKCLLASELYGRSQNRVTESKLLAINLSDGKVLWEIPTSGETGGLILSDGILYRVTTDGMMEAYDLESRQKAWNLNLAQFGHHASYGRIECCQNALLVSCNISTNYTLRDHARTIIVSRQTHERIAELPQVWIVGSQLLTYSADGMMSYDPKSLDLGRSDSLPSTTILEGKDGISLLLWKHSEENGLHSPIKTLSRDGSKFVQVNVNPRSILLTAQGSRGYFLEYPRTLIAIDLDSGRTLWSVEIERLTSVSSSDSFVVATSTNGKLSCFDALSGKLLWSYWLSYDLKDPLCDKQSIFRAHNHRLIHFQTKIGPALLPDAHAIQKSSGED